MKKLMLSAVILTSLSSPLMADEYFTKAKSIDNLQKKSIQKLSEYSIIVKWKNISNYNNLLQTPESKRVDKRSDLNKYQKHSYKESINVVSGDRDAGINVLANVYSETNLLLKHIRSSSKGVDLFKVQTNKKYKEVYSILMTTGLFQYISENKIIKTNNTYAPKPIPLRNRASNESGLTTPQSFDPEKYNDTYFTNSLYLDEQQAYLMGAHSVLKANDYVDANKVMTKKVRIAIVDTGKWEHEDVIWSEEGVDMVSWNLYSNCLSDDTTNSGMDITCPLADYEEKERDTDPTDKSWDFELDSDGNPIGDGQIKVGGHGLEVASTVAAIRNNAVGVIGSLNANDVELIAVRSLHFNMGLSIDLIDSILWSAGVDIPGVPSISEPVDIINLSLGGNGGGCHFNIALTDAINYAREKNIVVVAAAGNEYIDAKNSEPASCEGVLTVGANDDSGEMGVFSNFGDTVDVTFSGYVNSAFISTYSYKDPDISICINPLTGTSNGRKGCYGQVSGTSFSAPLASALAASIKMVNPSLSEGEIRKVIETTATEYNTDEHGNTNLRSKKMANANIGNYYNAVKSNFNITELDKGLALHHYANYTTPVKEIYLQEMEKLAGKDKVCNSYDLSWGLFAEPVTTITYELYVSNSSDEAMNSANSDLVVDPFNTTRVTPSSIVDMTGFTRVGVKSCKNGSCGSVYELDLTQAQLPNYCVN
ncbi:S8 family serine peptidase [Colwellia sp. MB3u-70]|uniref:S8 family serine peptidase n=1 Tax=unclassified Colwellia TaxID=196834 RepID=UPI0015F49805|nr:MULTISPECIES: S8 family serine peptidase [unclassified Colwellia]MBA6291251.1 S8 family serine peptidase [Colwellia sp. MB3u-8]MBA6307333.1 S8 family serine peptidase [Colwellia sp. MB3u-70]